MRRGGGQEPCASTVTAAPKMHRKSSVLLLLLCVPVAEAEVRKSESPAAGSSGIKSVGAALVFVLL
jgi:hypothetical protein